MNTIEFLSTILPPLEQNESYFSVGLSNGAPDVWRCSSVNEIDERRSAYVLFGYDAYMALASFGNTDGRKVANAKRLRSFWVDLDVGKKKNSYDTREDAAKAFAAFVKKTGLNPSIIVSSGKGFHVYWVIEEPMPLQVWLQAAAWFKSLCQQEGLIIDPACTADAARILRIPGSVHMKSGKTVEVIGDTKVRWHFEPFIRAVASHLSTQVTSVPAAPVTPAVSTTANLGKELCGMGPEPPKAHAERIANNCQQIATMGHAPEPVWYLGMNVLRRCIDGREWAHKLSAMDTTRYEQSQTDAKFDRAKVDSPTLCKTFELQQPEVCRQCRYYGKLKSPIELDRYAAPMAVPPAAAPASVTTMACERQLAQHLIIPDKFPEQYSYFTRVPGADFVVDNMGIHMFKAPKSADAQPIDIVICRAQLYFKRTEYLQGERGWESSYVFDAIYPDGRGLEELRMDTNDFMANPGRWLMNHQLFPTPGHKESLLMFINAYLEQVTSRSPLRHKFKTYGWANTAKDDGTDMGYVTSGCVITKNGAEPAAFTSGIEHSLRDVFGRKGNLEAWKVVPKLYKVLDQKLGQLAMCFGFAAPLMKYGTGEAKNCMLNIYSRQGGRGKSHVLRLVSSIWGDPAKAFFQKDSSIAARCKRLSAWNNMPAMMDELGHLSPEDIHDLVFTLITGVEKQKLTRESDFKETGDWSTCVLSTSNTSIKEQLARYEADSNAGCLRVMEYECDFQTLQPGSNEMRCVTACTQLANQNFGVAGPEFIYQLLQRPERLRLLENKVAKWVEAHEFSPEERFYSYPLGLALQAGRWAVEFGLLDYDMDALEHWVLTRFINHVRMFDKSLASSSAAVFTSYINANFMTRALVVKRADRTGTEKQVGADSTVPDSYILRRPTQGVCIRYEVENKYLFIDRNDFKEWCTAKGWSLRTVIKELEEAGFITSHDKRMSLGRNIKWLGTARTYCIELDPDAIRRCGLDDTLNEGVSDEQTGAS